MKTDSLATKGFFKKYGFWLIIVFIVPLVVSYALFMVDGFIPIGNIDKGSWLSFWGGFLAFYGTFFLGLVAIWQNEQSSKQNERLLNIENSRNSCNIILKNSESASKNIILSDENKGYDGTNNIKFSIINHGESILREIKIYFSSDKVFSSHITLAKGEEKNVIVKMPDGLDNQKRIKVFFIGSNGAITHGDFKISSEDNNAKIKHYHFYGLQDDEQDSI